MHSNNQIEYHIEALVACDPQALIGNKNKLPWHDKDELLHFYQTITNHPTILGYRTYLSLPKNYFHDREGIIFTRKHAPTTCLPNVTFVSSLKEFHALSAFKKRLLFVIGGAEIYRLFLENGLITKIIFTEMKKNYIGDTFFPLDLIQNWSKKLVQEMPTFYIYHFTPKDSSHGH